MRCYYVQFIQYLGKEIGGGESCANAAVAPSTSSLKYGELACASNGDLYVRNGSGNVVGIVTMNGNKTISGPITVNNIITVNQFSGYLNGSADQLDGYHENSFLGIEIMTREEIQKYPDRMVGTVSCVPEYEEWGDRDRGPVKVNGRIWIKVK